MSSVERLREVLGVPPGVVDRGDFDAVEASLGVELPPEVKGVCSLYGDTLISEYMTEKSLWVSELVREGHSVISRAVLPDAGGMLHWGHSVDGDKFFLEHRGGSHWAVSAFRRDWADWYESDETLIDWLVGVFTGSVAQDWMPEWPTAHWFEVGA
ncbi:SMI1/KNR4 family protein [Actinospica acidiphila]|nr:SMI1/KNR4 family protein [Actinospica acidiphila]